MEGDCFGCGDDNPVGLGLQFSVAPPGLVASFLPRPEHRGGPGRLHGGLAATCLDETMGALGFALDGTHCVTATLDLRYRRPVPIDGTAVRVEAWRERPEARRRQKVHGRLLLADGRVAVEATGIFVQVGAGEGGGPWEGVVR
ncbi:MAG TPA: PaaI family thioesterase [Acidimicrobiales bacterium]